MLLTRVLSGTMDLKQNVKEATIMWLMRYMHEDPIQAKAQLKYRGLS